VNFARENELLVAVHGGGHNVSGKALCDDGIVINLSGMKGIHVDAKDRRSSKINSNGLPRILMAAFARQYPIRAFRDLVIHR
jgi:hypothetical protein